MALNERKKNNRHILYSEYRFKFGEKLLYTLVYWALGGMVGFIFYGNLFMKDGEPTSLTMLSNLIVILVVGLIAVRLFLPEKRKQIIEERKSMLRLQFREMLASLSTAYASGDNTTKAFLHVQQDMNAQFGQNADISREVFEMVAGVHNGKEIDKLLIDFGIRSGVEDIIDFSNIFQICYINGGNMRSVVHNSYEMIGQKLEINEEIQTKITSNQTQQKIMSVVPIFMLAFLKYSSSSFAASFASVKGVISLTVAAGIFIFSYFYGKKIVDIKG